MMKRFLIVFLCVFAFIPDADARTFSLEGKQVLSAKNQPPCRMQPDYVPLAQRYQRGMLFRVRKCPHHPSYVAGTFHADAPEMLRLFEQIAATVPLVHAVGLEFVEDEQTAITAQQYMFHPMSEPAHLGQHLTEQEFAALAGFLEKYLKIPRLAASRLRPWAAAVLLQYPKPQSDGITLDKRLQLHATALGKPLFGLETPQEQYEIFARIPHEKQVTMLKEVIAQLPDIDAFNARFMQAYIDRDLRALMEMAEESFEQTGDPALRDYLKNELMTKRNLIMAERLAPRLATGNVLVAVGALHLPGDTGILTQLEQAGWQIEIVH